MGKGLAKLARQPFYLWLLGVYPILYLYSLNFGLVIDREFFGSVAGMLVATTIAFLVTNRFVRNRQKTAMMLSVASVCFSFSGHLYTQVFMPKSLFVWTLMISAATILVMVVIWRRGSSKFLLQVSAPLNLIALALLISPSITIASGLASLSSFDAAAATFDTLLANELETPKVNDSAAHPDIYYIIPDSYPSDAWLLETMDYDNSAFTQALRDRGFVVAPHAQSNYGSTLTSLASTLNMRYYDSNPSQLDHLIFLRLSIAESEVAQQLRQLGYTYVHLLSGLLVPSSIADINRDYAPAGPIDITVSESDLSTAMFRYNRVSINTLRGLGAFYKQSFISLYLDTTWLRVVKSQFNELFSTNKFAPYHVFAGARFLDTVADAESFASMPEATFTIVHLLKPHRPIVFNERGMIIPTIDWVSPEDFFSELEFVNSRFLQMIDTILENSRNQPVIIFQADHGSNYGNPKSPDRRHIYFDTYAAYYLPDGYSLEIPTPYTFINSFALILNEVFGTNYPLQEDRLLELLKGYAAPFEQKDVTEEFLHSQS